jgi:hypothetical protein
VLRALLAPAGDPTTPARLTVLLFGRPELAGMVGRKRALAARAAMTHALNPLNRRDTGAMVARRLRVSGAAAGTFDEAALDAIHVAAGGLPATTVRLAAAALDLAAALGRDTVDATLAGRAIALDGGAAEATGGREAVATAAPGAVQTSFAGLGGPAGTTAVTPASGRTGGAA